MTRTFDNKSLIKPLNLIDIDEAFYDWFDKKLNLYVTTNKGDQKKVPVIMVAPERWSLAREEGIRNSQGILDLPIIAIARTAEGGPNESGLGRVFADVGMDHTYYKKISPKSSLIKELNEARPRNIDPSLPIYEIYTHKSPDHFALTYEVEVWTSYIEEMNEIIQKLGQEYDYKSIKSFQFYTKDKFFFRSFQQDSISSNSNLDEYTNKERVVRKMFTYSVPGYIMPQSNQRRDVFKRFFSQTKLVITNETILNEEEIEALRSRERKG